MVPSNENRKPEVRWRQSNKTSGSSAATVRKTTLYLSVASQAPIYLRRLRLPLKREAGGSLTSVLTSSSITGSSSSAARYFWYAIVRLNASRARASMPTSLPSLTYASKIQGNVSSSPLRPATSEKEEYFFSISTKRSGSRMLLPSLMFFPTRGVFINSASFLS